MFRVSIWKLQPQRLMDVHSSFEAADSLQILQSFLKIHILPLLWMLLSRAIDLTIPIPSAVVHFHHPWSSITEHSMIANSLPISPGRSLRPLIDIVTHRRALNWRSKRIEFHCSDEPEIEYGWRKLEVLVKLHHPCVIEFEGFFPGDKQE
jgi:hypothetical protein